MNSMTLSPAGTSLLDSPVPGETEEEKRKRLAALQAQQQKIAAGLSPAGRELAMRGYLGGMLQ
jgi:hypothetical protein